MEGQGLKKGRNLGGAVHGWEGYDRVSMKRPQLLFPEMVRALQRKEKLVISKRPRALLLDNHLRTCRCATTMRSSQSTKSESGTLPSLSKCSTTCCIPSSNEICGWNSGTSRNSFSAL